MNPFPVSARGLRRRTLQTADRLLDGGALFPLFNGSGRVQQVLVLTAADRRIVLLPWEAERIYVPAWGPACLAVASASLRDVSDTEVARISRLWHFDPWWVLDAERYAGHWAVPPLKQTNCFGRLGRNVTGIYFRRDLSRVSWVAVRKKDGVKLVSWRESDLPARTTVTATKPLSPRGVAEWRLAPLWKTDPGSG